MTERIIEASEFDGVRYLNDARLLIVLNIELLQRPMKADQITLTDRVPSSSQPVTTDHVTTVDLAKIADPVLTAD